MVFLYLGRENEEAIRAYESSLEQFEAPSLFGSPRTEAVARPAPLSFFANYPITNAQWNEDVKAYQESLKEFGYVPARERMSSIANRFKKGTAYAGTGIATAYGFGKKAVGYTGRKIKQGYNYAAPKAKKVWTDSKPLRVQLGKDISDIFRNIGKKAV